MSALIVRYPCECVIADGDETCEHFDAEWLREIGEALRTLNLVEEQRTRAAAQAESQVEGGVLK